MRYQGRITEWNDGRGFGFVTPGGGGERVFLHISAFRTRPHRPQADDKVTYTLGAGPKGPVAQDVELLENPLHARIAARPAVRRQRTETRRMPWMLKLLPLLLVMGVVGGSRLFDGFQTAESPSVQGEPAVPLNQLYQDDSWRNGSAPAQSAASSQGSGFSCQGKTRCTQMTSCAEAQFYLQSCPGSVTDGDGDGRPCEDQWCGH